MEEEEEEINTVQVASFTLPNYLNFLKPRKISRIEQHENDTWPKISWDCVEFLEKGASSFYFEALKRGLNL